MLDLGARAGGGWERVVRAAADGWTACFRGSCLLPDGRVLVAGGRSAAGAESAVKTVELWDPATQAWSALPDMAEERNQASACVLPSGRVAVVGGVSTDNMDCKNGEMFDLVRRVWEPLPAEMIHARNDLDVVAVAGGLLAVELPCIIHAMSCTTRRVGGGFRCRTR